MPRTARKKTQSSTSDEPKFNIEERYEELNDAQKLLMIEEFTNRTSLGKRTFYLMLKRNILTDEVLQFFSEMFGCGIKDLYREKPAVKPTIFDLARRAKGTFPGKQASLDV